MKTKGFKRQRRRVRRLADRWVKPLGLSWWRVDHLYYDRRKRFKTKRGEVLFYVRADWRYAQAAIDVNLPLVAQMSDEELEEYYVHELSHIFLSEMRPAKGDGDDHEERVATTLAKAFVWLRGAVEERKR